MNLFVGFPEGTGVCYDLEGRASIPTVVEKITRQIPCKMEYCETLLVSNWLDSLQHFRVVTERFESGKERKMFYKLSGNDLIDVPALGTRVYRWLVCVLNEGALNFKVTFMNETTDEYLFYEIQLNIVKCPPLETINLKTCVRKEVSHVLSIRNPISTPLKYTIICNSQDLTCDKSANLLAFTEVRNAFFFNLVFR